MARWKMSLIAVILALLLAVGYAAAASEEINLAIQTSNNAKLLEEYLAWYLSENPGAKFTFSNNSSGQVNTLLLAGMPPAIQKRGVETYYQMAAQGVLQDITPLISKYNINLNDFFPPVVEAIPYQGHFYAIPAEGKPEMLYYNKQILARNGIAFPPTKYGDPSWTWDTLRKIAAKVTQDIDGDGVVDVWGVSGMPHVGQVGMMGSAWGAWWFDKDYNFIGDSPQMREALRFFADWVAEGTITLYNTFTSGKAAFRIGYSTSSIAQYQRANVDLGVAPVVTGHKPTINTDAFRFFKGTDVDAAMKFILALATDPNWAAKLAAADVGVPTLRRAIPIWMNMVTYPPEFIETIVDTMMYAQPRGSEYGPYQQLNSIIATNVEQMVLGQISMAQLYETLKVAAAEASY